MLTRSQLAKLRRADPMPNRLRVAMRLSTPQITQEQLADALGWSQPVISRLVTGGYARLSVDNARTLAKFFGCTVDDLFPAREEAVAS
jgi:transcriptional regulator with XRE-family HTH domain